MSHVSLIVGQRELFESGATLPIPFRQEQLRRFRDALLRHRTELERAIFEDFGKSEFETYGTELMLVLHDIEQAIAKLPRWSRPEAVRTNLVNLPGKSYVMTEPLGVTLVIGAWNYPYLLSLAPVVPALAAGNTVILKPSELTAATSRALKRIISETFDERYFAVVEGGPEVTTELLEQSFDKIFFTGSPAVGKIVYQAAAKRLIPVTLELGGKSPAFVAADCDVPLTARRIVWGKFLNAGQTCIAPDYVLVDASVQAAFLEACTAEIRRAEYSVSNGNYVRIINAKHQQRLLRLIDPDKVVIGGQSNDAERTIEPTLLRNVTWDDAVMQEEIFGPILPVLTYDNLESAIAQVRAQPKPLACYIFSSSRSFQRQILSGVSAGGVTINDTVLHIANPHLPFGGVGSSGTGRYHGEAGFRTFSNPKAVLHKATWVDLALRYSPLTPSKLRWLERVMRWSSRLGW